MKLVYTTGSIFRLPAGKYAGDPVEVGDIVTLREGEKVKVTYFRPPHKPSSQGKVSVVHVDPTVDRGEVETYTSEYYVSVIGAKWVEQELFHADSQDAMQRARNEAEKGIGPSDRDYRMSRANRCVRED